MDRAVKLDDESRAGAVKVRDEAADRMLAPPLVAGAGAVAERVPEPCCGLSLSLAKPAGSIGDRVRASLLTQRARTMLNRR
jgi:hypothetical protein